MLSPIVLNLGKKRLVKKAYAEIERKCTSSAFSCTFLKMTIMTDKSPRQITRNLQEAIADTWREKLSNVNVVMRNVNNSV